MGAHSGHRVAEGGTVLDAQPVDGVGVVAAPDLGGVVEHPRVEPAAAAAAPLDEDMRIIPVQLLQHLIDPQDVPVVHLPLALRGQGGGPNVGEAAVHIPLYIVDLDAVQDFFQLAIDVLPHLPAGEIQHQLAAPQGLGAAGDPQGPVRVLPVKLAVLAYHLRFHPDAKLHPQLPDAGHQGLQAAGELPLVHLPIPQAAVIIIPPAKPAVVHHKQLHAKLRGALCNLHQLVGGEIELGGLPVVDKHRMALPRQGVPKQVLADGPVELAAHLPKALGGENHCRLRGGEGLAGGQGPAEVERMDAQGQAVVFQLGALHRRPEVTAVQQCGPHAKAVLLPGVLLAEDDEGVVMVAGGAPDTAHALDAGTQGGAVQAALHGMAAVKGDKVQVPPVEIQAEGGGLAQAQLAAAPVDDPHRAGDKIPLRQHAVKELHLHLGGGIGQGKYKAFPLLSAEEGGEAGKDILALFQPVAGVPQVAEEAAVLRLQLQGWQAEIPHPAGGILLGGGVQGIGAVPPRLAGVGGEAPVGVPDEVGEVPAADAGPVVGVEQHMVGVGFHLVGAAFGVQGEDPVFFVQYDHRNPSLW